MKKLFVLLVITLLSAPVALLADAKFDSDAKVDSNPKIDFNAKCSKCHRASKNLLKQAELLGVDPAKIALRGSKMTREEMIAITEKGKDKMPGFEKELTKEQIADVVDYILSLKKRPNISRSTNPKRR